MSINFPEEQFAMQEAFKQYLLQHQTEIDRLWKQMTPESDRSPGNPNAMLPDIMGQPGNNNNDSNQVALIKVGITAAAIDKGTSGVVNITQYNGSAEAITGTSVTAWNLFGDVGATKKVAVAKDFDTSQWYIISAEC